MPKYLQDLTFSISVLLITNLISSFFRGVRGEIDLGGTGMLSRQDWVEVRGAATGPVARERLRREAHGRGGAGALPRKCWKIDHRKRVFQAFQALSSHSEGVGNSAQTKSSFIPALAQLYLKKWWWPVASPRFGVRGHDDRGSEGASIEALKAPSGGGVWGGVSAPQPTRVWGASWAPPAGSGAKPRPLSHFLHIFGHRTLLIARKIR